MSDMRNPSAAECRTDNTIACAGLDAGHFQAKRGRIHASTDKFTAGQRLPRPGGEVPVKSRAAFGLKDARTKDEASVRLSVGITRNCLKNLIQLGNSTSVKRILGRSEPARVSLPYSREPGSRAE